MIYINLVINYLSLMLIVPWLFRVNCLTKMAALSLASFSENITNIEEMPSSKRYVKKDRKRARSNDSDSDVELIEPARRRNIKNQFEISEILKNYQVRTVDNGPEKILKYVPEPVKDVFIPYMNHVRMINMNLDLISSLFKSNSKLLKSDLLDKFQDLANKTGNKINKFSNDLIEQLASNYSQDTVYEALKRKASSQKPVVNLDRIPDPEEEKSTSITSPINDDFDEYMDSDIDLQISEICDDVTNDAKSKDANPLQSSTGNNSNESTKKQELNSVPPNKNLDNLQYDDDGYLVIYTDGCCLANGRNNAQAGIGVWFNYNHPLNVAAPTNGTPTNNNAEIQAATKAIRIASSVGCKKIRICTDSMFLINCMTTWVKNWKRNNWKTAEKQPVKNRESLEELDSVIKLVDSVQWKHILGHKGCPGNEEADALAKKGAQLYRR